jgi:hypothetical protein
MKITTKTLANPSIREAEEALALAIDKMMNDMDVRLTTNGQMAIIEVMHPKGYEYPPIEITVKKIVSQFIKDELGGSPWDDDFPESTKEIVDSFYNQSVRLKKAFDKYASQKYIPKK